MCCAAKPNYYHHRIPPDVMNSYLADVERLGWPRAFYQLQRSMERDGESVFANAEQGHLAGWKFFLPIDSSATTLVLGASTEVVPLSLAASCGSVVAVDATRQRLDSLLAVAEFRRQRNVTCIHARTLDELPFLDAYFDLIVISDLQDWIKQFSANTPRTMPLSLLRMLRKFLKPDGALFVAGDNRFTYTGLVGGDLSSDVSLAPDDAEGSGGARRSRKSSTSSHSYRGYQRTLREAGMRTQWVFAPVPNHRNPREVVDLSRSGSVSSGSSQRLGSFLRERLKVNPHFLRAFGHSFAVVASAQDTLPDSYFDRLFRDLEQRLKLQTFEIEELKLKDYEAAAFCRAGDLPILLRLPYSLSLAQLTLKNADVLKRLNHRRLPRMLGEVMPTWLHHGEFNGQIVTAESRMAGVALEHVVDQLDTPELCNQLSILLHSLSSVRGSDTGRTGAPLIEQMADTISPKLIDPSIRREFYSVALEVCEQIRAAELPGVLVHGAFDLRNIMWDNQRSLVSGLVNWHGSMQHGLPGWDLICLESAMVRHRFECSKGDSVLWLLENGSPPELHDLWERYAHTHRLTDSLRPVLLLSYWIGLVWREFMSELAPLNHRWLRYNVMNVLARANEVLRRSGNLRG